MEYCCPRCGYDTNILGNFKKHINKKFLCDPYKSNVSLDALKALHNKKKDILFVCEKCSKGFSSRSGYLTHKKNCKHAPKEEEVVPVQTVTNMFNSIVTILNRVVTAQAQMIATIESLQNGALTKSSVQIDETEDTKSSVQIDVKNDTKIILQIEEPLEFGQYTVDHVYSDKAFIKKVMEDREQGLVRLIKAVWCDEKYPKNMSFRIGNKKVEVYTSQQGWHEMHVASFVDDLMCYCEIIIDDFVHDNKTLFSKTFLDSYMVKIGLPLEWDISHDSYKCASSMEEEEVEKEKKRIYKYVIKELGIN